MRRRSDEEGVEMWPGPCRPTSTARSTSSTARRVARHLEACRRCGLDAEIYTRIDNPLSRMERDVSSLPLARLRDFAIRLAEDADPDVGEPPA